VALPGAGVEANTVALSGTLLEVDALRHSPAGVPVLSFAVRHASSQVEAGRARDVVCEVAAVALGDLARLLAERRPGERVSLEGFLANRSHRSAQLVLHATQLRD
jgi:primosomal replication protein N